MALTNEKPKYWRRPVSAVKSFATKLFVVLGLECSVALLKLQILRLKIANFFLERANLRLERRMGIVLSESEYNPLNGQCANDTDDAGSGCNEQQGVRVGHDVVRFSSPNDQGKPTGQAAR